MSANQASVLRRKFRLALKDRDRIKQERENEKAQKYKTNRENIGVCCCKSGGNIVLVTSYTCEYDPKAGPLIIGPGSKDQFRMVKHQDCYCEACGLLYNPDIVRKGHG